MSGYAEYTLLLVKGKTLDKLSRNVDAILMQIQSGKWPRGDQYMPVDAGARSMPPQEKPLFEHLCNERYEQAAVRLDGFTPQKENAISKFHTVRYRAKFKGTLSARQSILEINTREGNYEQTLLHRNRRTVALETLNGRYIVRDNHYRELYSHVVHWCKKHGAQPQRLMRIIGESCIHGFANVRTADAIASCTGADGTQYVTQLSALPYRRRRMIMDALFDKFGRKRVIVGRALEVGGLDKNIAETMIYADQKGVEDASVFRFMSGKESLKTGRDVEVDGYVRRRRMENSLFEQKQRPPEVGTQRFTKEPGARKPLGRTDELNAETFTKQLTTHKLLIEEEEAKNFGSGWINVLRRTPTSGGAEACLIDWTLDGQNGVPQRLSDTLPTEMRNEEFRKANSLDWVCGELWDIVLNAILAVGVVRRRLHLEEGDDVMQKETVKDDFKRIYDHRMSVLLLNELREMIGAGPIDKKREEEVDGMLIGLMLNGTRIRTLIREREIFSNLDMFIEQIDETDTWKTKEQLCQAVRISNLTMIFLYYQGMSIERGRLTTRTDGGIDTEIPILTWNKDEVWIEYIPVRDGMPFEMLRDIQQVMPVRSSLLIDDERDPLPDVSEDDYMGEYERRYGGSVDQVIKAQRMKRKRALCNAIRRYIRLFDAKYEIRSGRVVECINKYETIAAYSALTCGHLIDVQSIFVALREPRKQIIHLVIAPNYARMDVMREMEEYRGVCRLTSERGRVWLWLADDITKSQVEAEGEDLIVKVQRYYALGVAGTMVTIRAKNAMRTSGDVFQRLELDQSELI